MAIPSGSTPHWEAQQSEIRNSSIHAAFFVPFRSRVLAGLACQIYSQTALRRSLAFDVDGNVLVEEEKLVGNDGRE